MKKEIVCPVCGGRGYVSWINSTEASCYSGSKTCPHCNGEMMVEVDVTNADHIRSMTDEELINVVTCPMGFSMFRCTVPMPCGDCKREWLKQPYKEAEDEKA